MLQPAVRSSPAPSKTRPSTAALAALAHRADQALDDVTTAYHAFISNRTSQSHGALSLAVAHAQQLLRALEAVREQRERQRQQQGRQSTSQPPSSLSRPSADAHAPGKDEIHLYMRLDKVRIDLRRVLPRAVAAAEEADTFEGGAAGSTRSAASTAAALRSLLHTRSMLSIELQKMDTVVQSLAGSGETLAALHQSLLDVHSSMATAQQLVRALLTVQSRDDVLLRVSAMVFALVVLYVVVQRVFRFFPATVYVDVGEDTPY
jgi:hypothetical protein